MYSNTTARNNIMARIRAGKPAAIEHPIVPQYSWPGDPKENFVTMLKSFDGNSMEFDSREAAVAWLKSNLPADKVICSAISDYEGTVSPYDYPDPHKASNIDICVAEALLGVGEMGSCFVTDRSLGKPACALFSTDLYLLLDKSKIVPSMHQAYAAIHPEEYAYSSFFTGPSATADIEAIHITGAQAEISLTVLLY